MNRRENVVRNIDLPLVVIYLVLMALGWANIYSAAYDPAHANLFDRSREYGAQSVWICISLLIGAGNPTELLQTKHHQTSTATLTDASTDL